MEFNKLEALKKVMTRYEERARARLTSLKWLIGITWAGANYLFSKSLDSPRNSAQAVLELVIVASALIIGAVVAYFLVSAYEAAINRLFRGIEFGLNEAILELESNPVGSANAVQ
jgi:hypothetical protein